MFLRHARATRFAAAYLLFSVALLMVPKVDVPETLFDESNTPTNEMVVVKAASSLEYRRSMAAFVPRIFAQPRRISFRRILPVYPGQLTDSHTLRELFCSYSANPTLATLTAFWFESDTDMRRSPVRGGSGPYWARTNPSLWFLLT